MRAFILALLMLTGCRQAEAQDVAVDGRFADWDSLAVLATDRGGDAGASGVDFTRLQASDDVQWLYLSFDTGVEILLQEDNAIRLSIDTDMDAATGTQVQGIGAELTWTFGDREGSVRLAGTTSVRHDDIRLILAPSMRSSRFEIAIRRGTSIGGRPLFPSESIRFALSDAGGDALPDAAGGIVYRFRSSGVMPVIERLLRPVETGSIRLLSWNTLFNGLADPQRQSAYTRLLRAIKPDVMCFQECFDMSAGEALTFVRSVLDPPAGRTWQALKRDAGNILVTHLEIENSWLLQSEYRESAYLLRTPADEAMLLINAHFRCCSADDHRQKEADGVIRFLRDAKLPGGIVTVPEGTPFVLVGDLNLVGENGQYHTLVTGDIKNNASFGADEAPDWNGGHWTELEPRHPASLFTFTWDDNGSSYAPGKLDYMLYSASALTVTQDMVVDPRQISAGQRQRLGIEQGDASAASDHLPRFADFKWKQVSTVETAAARGWNIGQIYPQPARSHLAVTVDSDTPVELSYQLFDLLGRSIGALETAQHANHALITLPLAHPGTYLLVVSDGVRKVVRTVVAK
jgi:endonuclease/exonuclease/phosphatase family metal-dependent hydrolase